DGIVSVDNNLFHINPFKASPFGLCHVKIMGRSKPLPIVL
ncbi:hypothetical protein LCGC14_1926100, partial [marine sediment metagenome]